MKKRYNAPTLDVLKLTLLGEVLLNASRDEVIETHGYIEEPIESELIED